MKTKALLSRYPRKISLLKDLTEEISPQMVLPKSMKTGIDGEIPSKISLLKDLTGAFRSRRTLPHARERVRVILNCQRTAKPLLLSNS